MTDELIRVSPSRIANFQSCPKKYNYTYRMQLVPKLQKNVVHLDIGSYTHEVFHAYYQLVRDVKMQPGSDQILAAIQHRVQNDLDLALQTNPSDLNLDIYATVAKLLSRYVKIHSAKVDQGIQVLYYEHALEVPITLPSGRTVLLFGFVDLIYRDARGKIVVRDHKTGKKVQIWTPETVEANLQLLFYAAALYHAGLGVPDVEINFVSTHDYANGNLPPEAFSCYRYPHSEAVYKNFLKDTCILIDEMLDSHPTPHYSSDCVRCPFYPPCRYERKGINPEPVLLSHYRVSDRYANKDNTSGSENGDKLSFHPI